MAVICNQWAAGKSAGEQVFKVFRKLQAAALEVPDMAGEGFDFGEIVRRNERGVCAGK